MVGVIFTNPEGARFVVTGRYLEKGGGWWWVCRNLDQVFDVPAGALWKRKIVQGISAASTYTKRNNHD